MKSIVVSYILGFALNVVTFSLGVAILSDTQKGASIASYHFMDGGVSLHGIYVGIIFLGFFHFLLLLVTSCVVFIEYENANFYLFISNFIFNLITEALFFKFASCFNFTNNTIVIARSSLMILLQIMSIIIFSKILKEELKKTLLGTICKTIFYIVTSIVIIVLNLVLLAHLKPELNYNIEASSIRMGFFNSTEINSIQMGTYMKTDFYSHQLIGNLSDVLFSSKIVFDHEEKRCEKESRCINVELVNIYFKQYILSNCLYITKGRWLILSNLILRPRHPVSTFQVPFLT